MKNRFVIIDLPFGGRDEFERIEGMPEFRTACLPPQKYEGGAQVLILPGSGKTIADLEYLRANGGDRIIREHLAGGGVVVGVCGGYQMLGERLFDPYLRQGHRAEVEGFGLLPITTVFGPAMLNSKTTARLLTGNGQGGEVVGEEHRSGYSSLSTRDTRHVTLHKVTVREFLSEVPAPAELLPGMKWCPGRERKDGLVSADRRVWGTYFHLIFYSDAFLRTLFGTLG